MTKADLERFESALLALKTRLRGDVSNLAGEALKPREDAPATSSDLADQSADSYEQEFTLNLLQTREQTLEEIDEALDRIARGVFGRCEECGGAIPGTRLQALPYARHCVECARKLQ